MLMLIITVGRMRRMEGSVDGINQRADGIENSTGNRYGKEIEVS
jgi:hypothetical protein